MSVHKYIKEKLERISYPVNTLMSNFQQPFPPPPPPPPPRQSQQSMTQYVPDYKKYNINCFEYVLANAPDNLYYNVSSERFDFILSHLKKTIHFKQESHTSYFHKDLVYESHKADVKTYRMIPLHIDTNEKNFIKLNFFKEKIPFYMFPSTLQIHNIIDIHSMYCKIDKNLTIIFEKQTFKEQPLSVRKIYLQCKNEVDSELATKFKKLIQSLGPTL